MKYRVLKKCSLVVEKDSIVELDPIQAKLAKGLIIPFIEATEEKVEEVKEVAIEDVIEETTKEVEKETKKKTTKKKGE